MNETTLLLLMGVLTVVWWSSVWGLLDAFVSATKRPVFIYSVLVLLVISFLYKHPEIADRLL